MHRDVADVSGAVAGCDLAHIAHRLPQSPSVQNYGSVASVSSRTDKLHLSGCKRFQVDQGLRPYGDVLSNGFGGRAVSKHMERNSLLLQGCTASPCDVDILAQEVLDGICAQMTAVDTGEKCGPIDSPFLQPDAQDVLSLC